MGSQKGGKELRARYGINLSLEELYSIRKALMGKGDKCLMERLDKAIKTIEGMKKRRGRRQGND